MSYNDTNGEMSHRYTHTFLERRASIKSATAPLFPVCQHVGTSHDGELDTWQTNSAVKTRHTLEVAPLLMTLARGKALALAQRS